MTEDMQEALPGAVIDRRYSDVDRSASRFARRDPNDRSEDPEPERPEWQRMQRDLRTLPLPRGIVFWESSRAVREMGPWVKFLNFCRKRGILLRFKKDGRTYDPRNPSDRAALLQQGINAEVTSEETSARVQRNMRAAARKGRPHGPSLYGYIKVYGYRGDLTAVEVNDLEAAIVHEIHWRIARNEAPGRICDDLNRRGVLPPRAAAAARELEACDDPERRAVLAARIDGAAWGPVTIRQIVLSHAYTGERVHRGQVAGKAMWEPVVSQTLAAQARAVIAARARTGERPGRYKYLLSFIAECGVCQGPLQGLTPSAHRPYESYACQSMGRHVVRRSGLLDEYITEAVISRLSDPGLLRFLKGTDDAAREIQEALDAALEKEQRLEEAIASHARTGKPSLAMVTRMEEELLPLIERDRDRARQLAVTPLLEGLTGPEELVRESWGRLHLPQRREVIRYLVIRISLFPAGRNRRVPLRDTVVIKWAGEDPADEDDST